MQCLCAGLLPPTYGSPTLTNTFRQGDASPRKTRTTYIETSWCSFIKPSIDWSLKMEGLAVHIARDVYLARKGSWRRGDILFLPHHLVFELHKESGDDDSGKSPSPSAGRSQIWICYPMVESISTLRGSSSLLKTPLHENGHTTTPSLIPSSSSTPSASSPWSGSSHLKAAHMRLRCHDFTFYSFNFAMEEDCSKAYLTISKLAMGPRIMGANFYAHEYKRNTLEQRVDIDGWEIYNPEKEYQRQGLLANQFWRISSINSEYRLCPLYPRYLITPSSVSDTVLQHAAKFRLKLRIPAVVYRHRIGANHNIIARCSQPLVGLRQNRLIQDEKLVTEIFLQQSRERDAQELIADAEDVNENENRPLPNRNGHSGGDDIQHEIGENTGSDSEKHNDDLRLAQQQPQRNLLVDLRPITNAMAQHALGAGTENTEHYQVSGINAAKYSPREMHEGNQILQLRRLPQSHFSVEKIFCNIDNIHVIRDASNKLASTLSDYDDQALDDSAHEAFSTFQQRLHKTHWLNLLSIILQAVDRITKSIHFNNTNVIIHCLDGWDRTLQVSALLQLCLDPFYRTIRGFIILVEKEWVSFGFKFKTRADHGGCVGARIPRTTSDPVSVPPLLLLLPITANGDDASIPDGEEKNDADSSGFAGVTSFLLRAATRIKNGASIIQEASDISDSKLFHHTRPFSKTFSASNEKLPVFHQFLDCVFQLTRQHPDRFEFNSRFLKRLFYHYYSCQYGTFLSDCEMQMAQIRSLTVLVWDYFLSRPAEFSNSGYSDLPDHVLLVNYLDVKWWCDLYGRTDHEMNGFSHNLEKKLAKMGLA